MNAQVLLNELNELKKINEMRGLSSILSHFRNVLIHSMIQEHECLILFLSYDTMLTLGYSTKHLPKTKYRTNT